MGTNDVIDKSSGYYKVGSAAGAVNNIAVSGGLTGVGKSVGLARAWNTSRFHQGFQIGSRRFMLHAPHRIGEAGHRGLWLYKSTEAKARSGASRSNLLMTSSDGARVCLDVNQSGLATAQVIGVHRQIINRLGDRPVIEVWVPQAEAGRAFDILPPLAAAIAASEQQSGTIRAARNLVLGRSAAVVSDKEEIFFYADVDEALQLLQRGWNASLNVLQAFPASTTAAELQTKPLEHLVFNAPFAVACAHDGEAIQVISLVASLERVWHRVVSAAATLDITLRD